MTVTSRSRSPFERLAGWAYRRRWIAVLAWVAVLAAVTAASQAAGSDYRNDFSLPGTESQAARDVLGSAQAGDTVQIVFQAPAGVRASDVREDVEALLADIRPLPHVAAVTSPYEGEAAISADATIAYASVALDAPAEAVPRADVERLLETARAAESADIRVEVGGDAVRGLDEEGGAAEGAGLLAALVILVFMFGSLLAASLPVVIALFAVGSAVGLIALASHVATIADFTPPLMTLVGLGVGIDYALLVFSRHRGELLAGADRREAVRTALDTAGRTVLFAGCTVIIALLGLVALGIGSLQGVAVAMAVTVLVTMIAALTLLPALLAAIGGRVERGVRRRAERGRRPEGEGWRRWAALVQRRPWPAAVAAVLVLLALALPALDMRLGFADAGTDSPSSTSRQAYELLAEGFGPGVNGPLLVVADGGGGDALQRTLAGTPGVARAAGPIPAGGDAAMVIAYPRSTPQASETKELVERLRDEVLPPLERKTGARLLVGGPTAAAVDFADAVSGRLPLFVGVVVGLSALLLLAVFRSVAIPLKAAVLNLLSVGASLGVITLVFQEGLLGAEPGPVEAFIPVMIFAIVFGLSMDYEVFLLARMHEAWERSRDAPQAVRDGLATTGRVVTAAAAIMVVVFGAFVLSPDRMLQQFGLGLAVAILLDALVIRCLIVPAAMQVLGARAWWLPRSVARRLPRLALER